MQTTPTDSLVLYKNRLARVRQAGERLEREPEDSHSQKVRPKDAALLHPGPLRGLAELRAQAGNRHKGKNSTGLEIAIQRQRR